MDSEPPNAIEQRLAKLTALWSGFREKPDARICRWLVKEDEVQMLRGFIEYAQSPDSDVPDLFFPFNTAYTKPERYSTDLVDELHTRLLNEKEKSDININWQPTTNTIGKDSAQYFISNFFRFCESNFYRRTVCGFFCTTYLECFNRAMVV